MSSEEDATSNTWYRNQVAAWVMLGSAILIAVLCVGVLVRGSVQETHNLITVILPVVGTWVGTVLAYYFSKDNLETATKSVQAIAKQLTPQERLSGVPVKDKMVARRDMHITVVSPTAPAASLNLIQTVDLLDGAQKGQRIPILDDKDTPIGIVHRSAVDAFIVQQARATPPQAVTALTMASLLNDPAVKAKLANSFAVIRQDGTLAQAKEKMDNTPGCQDVFVTASGTVHEPVLGWVTNRIIEQHLIV